MRTMTKELDFVYFSECYRCGVYGRTIQLYLPHPEHWCITCIEGEMMANIAAKARQAERAGRSAR